jgi:membrane protein implicated in regulation of membrane protease activity
VSRLATYALCLVMFLSGPGFLALVLLLDASVWAGIVIAAALSLVLVPLGVTLGRDVTQAADQRRLAERSRAGS